MGMTYNAVIIGGGAEGMMCALHLAERGIGNVLLL